MIRQAAIDGNYRYSLYRRWEKWGKAICWIMLNPSKADDKIEDATIRRCIGFSDYWGYSALYVGNLNPYRSTNPNLVIAMDEHIALYNTNAIIEMVHLSDKVVCAWGTMGLTHPPAFLGTNTWHLGLTKEGYPKHPLRLSKQTTLTQWR
jgi:hypothetical protein